MSFVYPRKITVYRSRSQGSTVPQGVGLLGYSGRENTELASDPNGFTVILEDVPASIQSRGIGRTQRADLPTAATARPQWRILTRKLPISSIRDMDVIQDDEGYRYIVGQAAYTPMGYKLDCVRLEA